MTSNLAAALWPHSQAAECFSALTGRQANPGALEAVAKHAGYDANPLEVPFADLEATLPELQNAILRLPDGLLAIRDGKRGKVRASVPGGGVRTLAISEICNAIRRAAGDFEQQRVEQLIKDTGIHKTHAKRAAAALLKEQLRDRRFTDGCTFSLSPANKPRELVGQTQLVPNALLLTAAHAGYYLLWLASWAIMGKLSFEGRMDRAWLLAWALLLATLVPFQLFTTWAQGRIAIEFGSLLKRRLLFGAMKLLPEEVRGSGAGSFLGQALEAEAVESLALSGGIAGLLATIEIVMAAFVLGRYSLLLAAWCAVTIFLAGVFLKRYQSWTGTRLEMTNDLVEAMVGHRTRLAQQKPSDWHCEEDQAHANYAGQSTGLDTAGSLLVAAIPRGWLIAGLAALAPAIVAAKTSSTELAVTLGGILLAYTAFKRMTASYLNIALAWVAWKRIRPLFTAAARLECLGDAAVSGQARAENEIILEAERLTFRHRKEGNPALQGGSLTVRRGDRILLEGPSGGGKSTFASLLCGMRKPESGLLLAGGLDAQTLGWDGWRERIAAAPQFHENHIFTGTLAFNLLMGRNWPPKMADMEDADNICRELGLGDLLDRMPSGLNQIVGEGGWQLSHGERSRIFMARALLAKTDLVILDESFAALDPENLRTAMESTLRRAETLMVIAHP